jgi:hypothetical protein
MCVEVHGCIYVCLGAFANALHLCQMSHNYVCDLNDLAYNVGPLCCSSPSNVVTLAVGKAPGLLLNAFCESAGSGLLLCVTCTTTLHAQQAWHLFVLPVHAC